MINLAPDASPVNPDEPDGHRPTAGPKFTPSRDDDAEAVALLNADAPDGRPEPTGAATVNDWDYRAERAYRSDRVESGPLF